MKSFTYIKIKLIMSNIIERVNSILENVKNKILWNVEIYADHLISPGKPDLGLIYGDTNCSKNTWNGAKRLERKCVRVKIILTSALSRSV